MCALMYFCWIWPLELVRALVCAIFDLIPHFRYYSDISPKMENYTVFPWNCFFKGCLNGGPRRRSDTDARYSQQLQTGTRPESVRQDGSFTLGLALLEEK